ncbi:MAG: choice-of-anchor Q domain-containing protein [Candidatus Heimdallarchaeaceae archaeon]
MATYYFDAADGNDSYNTTQAQNPATPWKTIAKCSSMENGDTALFKCGETFEYTPESGYILAYRTNATYDDYGTGNAPILKVSETVTTEWSVYSGSVYQTTLRAAYQTKTARSCWEDDSTRLQAGADEDSLSSSGMYYFNSTTGVLYVRCSDDESPAINAGDNSVWNGIASVTDYEGNEITDSEGNIVAHGDVVDIGAYESQYVLSGNKRATLMGVGVF